MHKPFSVGESLHTINRNNSPHLQEGEIVVVIEGERPAFAQSPPSISIRRPNGKTVHCHASNFKRKEQHHAPS